MNTLKNFVKELKRVRWPKANDARRTFSKTVMFIILCALVFFALAIIFTALWNRIGVGLSG